MDDEDEILVAVTRDELRDCGLDDDEIAESISAMRDQGMFRAPLY